MAISESDVQPADCGREFIALVAAPVRLHPVNCRGMELLGIADPRGFSAICVHQFFVARYDTPRATVQKNIAKLNVRLHNFTKEQVRTLRKEGIVDGCLATAIRVGDAEKVFDALEKSRNMRRGITKHRLLRSQDRNLRQEQVKINKAHLKRQLLLAGTCDNREANTPASVGADKEKGRNAAEAGLPLPLESRAKTSRPGFGTLLVAKDSYHLSNLCEEEFLIEVVAAADLYQQQQLCMQQGTLLGMDPSTTEDSTGAKGHMEAKSHEVQAPVLGTSYLNKHHSVSTSGLSPNGETTSNRSSPVRSRFLESAVSDCLEGNPDQNPNQNNTSTVPSCSFSQQYSGGPHESKGSEGTVAGGSSEGEERGGTAGSTHTLQPFPGDFSCCLHLIFSYEPYDILLLHHPSGIPAIIAAFHNYIC